MAQESFAQGRRLSLAEAQDRLLSVVDDVERHGPVELTDDGRPVAVIVSPDDYRRLTGVPRDVWSAYEQFRASVDFADVDVDELLRDIRDPSPGRDATW
ncbi:MAG: type II toxin-antitoxin system Phd/YefM family antitoxin [Chloroflexota bacterium]